MELSPKQLNAQPNGEYSIVSTFRYISTMTELKRDKQTLLENNYGILTMASNFVIDYSKFFQTVYYGSQWHSRETHEVQMRILESVENGINEVDVIYYADN